MTETGVDFQIRRADLQETRLLSPRQPPTPGVGEVLLRIDRFALTSNNITYAHFGEAMGYWRFFPAPDGWGHLPVWGFAEVERSRHPDVPEGERLYGCLPTARHWVIAPQQIRADSLSDGSPARTGLPPFYSQYSRTRADPSYRYAFEDQQMLLRPLFATAALLDDLLAHEQIFAARQVILSSASSKTAIALAFLLRSGRRDCRVVGLTSKPHRRFVQSTGYYDEVVDYARVGALSPGVPSVYVDFAGDRALLRRIHEHFGEDLCHSCSVGGTHHGDPNAAAAAGGKSRPATEGARERLPGPRPAFFFAPDHVRARIEREGVEGFARWLDAAWLRFVEASAYWLRIEHQPASTRLDGCYQEALAGRVDPALGRVVVFGT